MNKPVSYTRAAPTLTYMFQWQMVSSKAVSDHDDEILRQERKELSEERFKLNLKRLCGRTSAVTIDDMCEVIGYIQENGVYDLSFVEEAYKSSIFSDDEFLEKTGIIVDSFERFIAAWVNAKENNYSLILKLFRDKHRVARQFLEEPGIKDRIREYDRNHDQRNLHKEFYDLLLLYVRFVRRHVKNPATSYLKEQVIPNMSALASRIDVPVLNSDSCYVSSEDLKVGGQSSSSNGNSTTLSPVEGAKDHDTEEEEK